MSNNKQIFIHVIQSNNRDCWINPSHIVRINKIKYGNVNNIELIMLDSQIIDLNCNEIENQEMIKYLDLDRKPQLF